MGGARIFSLLGTFLGGYWVRVIGSQVVIIETRREQIESYKRVRGSNKEPGKNSIGKLFKPAAITVVRIGRWRLLFLKPAKATNLIGHCVLFFFTNNTYPQHNYEVIDNDGWQLLDKETAIFYELIRTK
jgi:hypothetical protein